MNKMKVIHKLHIMKDTLISLENLVVKNTYKTGIDVSEISDKVLNKIGFGTNASDFYKPIKMVESLFNENTQHIKKDKLKDVKKALVAQIALNMMTSIDKLNLPDSIIALYPQAFEILALQLSGNEESAYDITDDIYCKDIRFVLGISIPCGAQVVDTNAIVSPISAILSILRSKEIGGVIRYIYSRAYGTWFRIHTDIRYLKEFNEYGWDQCYIRIADLLERRPNIRGMVGTSWFYDPKLLEISPRLGYLQQRPLERGAFRLRHGSSKIDIERATSKSKVREMLYEEGKYLPVSYSILWPRESMVGWARFERESR